ncbi:MAG: UDP-N-acetylmuramate--L-alanine ligase [Candidatus Staskawiczbacteria bacterium]|nr:UDP-N-acetylmuramate--L-alanine ligase [Candidatus Staskawiczbacteria bacterium]
MRIHFIGIGGIGVSALAQYYFSKGHIVSGSDLVPSEITELLRKKGVKIITGPHSKNNLSEEADLVIYSPAVRPDNPEYKKAKESDIKLQSYPEALGDLTKEYFTIAVSGTHGKSTTTAMIALVLIKGGVDPTVILGTKLREFGDTNFRVGKSRVLVIEADEHFASFLNYWPKVIVLTNIEKEHLDYYKTLNNVIRTYKKYLSHLKRDGILVANKEDKNINKTIKEGQYETIFYSIKQKESQKLKKVLRIPGQHNVYNALAVLAVAKILRVPNKISFKVLSQYKGSWRRFEEHNLKFKNTKLKIISDYGHHPTEVLVTLKAVREKYSKKEIWCVFQPHQHQRTHYLFKDFMKVIRQAENEFIDKIIITDIYDVAGRETKKINSQVNSKRLVEKIARKSVIYVPTKKLEEFLKKKIKNIEVLIIMGAGDIYELAGKFQ